MEESLFDKKKLNIGISFVFQININRYNKSYILLQTTYLVSITKGTQQMESFKDNTIRGLKEIINNCRHTEIILRNSVNDSDNNSLKKIFTYYADLNSSYIQKLQTEILRLGGIIEVLSSEKFNCWEDDTDFKDKLKICENSVNDVVNNYKEFSLREDILSEVVPVISQQYFGEKEAQETIKNIRNTELPV
jgi:hypothetical protein